MKKNAEEKILNAHEIISQRIIETYFAFEKDELLLKYFRGFAKIAIEMQAKLSEDFSKKSIYQFKEKLEQYYPEFIKENPKFKPDKETLEKIAKFSSAIHVEYSQPIANGEVTLKEIEPLERLLTDVAFVEGDEAEVKRRFDYTKSIAPKEKEEEIKYLKWLKEASTLSALMNSVESHGITTSKNNLHRFFKGENVMFTIPDNKLEHFALLVNKLFNLGCFKMSFGKWNYLYFQKHIKDFSKSKEKDFSKGVASKLNNKKFEESDVVREINAILSTAKII